MTQHAWLHANFLVVYISSLGYRLWLYIVVIVLSSLWKIWKQIVGLFEKMHAPVEEEASVLKEEIS